jgi:membrane protein DedA with SNARE-associated domain
MWEEILKAITAVLLPSMIKFVFGPLAGYSLGLNVLTTIVATVAGMMAVVVIVIYSGQLFREKIERFFAKRRGTGKVSRMIQKYGLAGVAFLTPLILTPIGGSLLALGFLASNTRRKILLYMLISGTFWGTIFTVAIYFFGDIVLAKVNEWL